jgi:septal ring factor EnvC (AmiA/AmiB activator)
MAVLTNLGPCTCHGGSCASPGAILRVVVLVLMPLLSSILRLEGLVDGGSWAQSWQAQAEQTNQEAEKLSATIQEKVTSLATVEEQLRQERSARKQTETQLQQERATLEDAQASIQRKRSAREGPRANSRRSTPH